MTKTINDQILTGLLYLSGAMLLGFYGVQVCPFLDNLSPFTIMGILLVGYFIAWILRLLIVGGWRRQEADLAHEALLQLPRKHFFLDLALWAGAGLLLAFWNMYHYGFPLSSGLKVVLGSSAIGFFVSYWLSLQVERRIIDHPALLQNTRDFHLVFRSISSRFFWFILLAMAGMCVILLLMVYHDLYYAVKTVRLGEAFRFRWILQEFVFVFGFFLIGCTQVVRSYAYNRKLVFDRQQKVFMEVQRGQYDTLVPIVTNDEFGVVALHTNEMVAGLQEKQRIRNLFGKYMSTSVAEAILGSAEGEKLGGRQCLVALMFMDLRNFTPLAEQVSAEKLVELLNRWFGMAVKVIQEQEGVVDKFIGDAVMAVWGLDGGGNPCRRALAAAKGIITLHAARAQEDPELADLAAGIGLHFGSVIAGNIGSPDRLEYTVIGDTVNVASRLETATRELGVTLLASEAFVAELGPGHGLNPAGAVRLKGKKEPQSVYTL